MVERFKENNVTLVRFAHVSLSVGSLAFATLLLWKGTTLPGWVALIPAPTGGFVARGKPNLTELIVVVICFGALRKLSLRTGQARAACATVQQSL